MTFVVAGAALAATTTASAPARAYRPFEGTDADVADEGEFELELGPASYQRYGADKFLIVPATVLNLGLVKNWELVVDWRNFVKLKGEPSTPRVHFEESDVFLKVVLREGALQEKTGLSIATEFGPLLPNYRYESGYGASDNVITSLRLPSLTLHLNTAIALSRAHELDGFAGLIVEGPFDWKVRPVAEVMVESEHAGQQIGAVLVGAIWNAGEHLSVDAAVRGARIDGVPVQEIRAGFTWATSVWGGAE